LKLHSAPGLADIYYEKDIQAIRIEWFSMFSADNTFRDVICKSIELAKQRNIQIVIGDQRAAVGTSKPADVEWFANELMPLAVQSGIRYFTSIMPQSALSKLNSKRIIDKAEGQAMIHSFGSMEEVREWVKTQATKK